MTSGIGVIIDSLVAILLVLTIGYCMLLNRRLKMLKADEQSLRATISELVTATEIAERAIGGLKQTVRECDETLGERLRNADGISSELARQIEAGEDIMRRMLGVVIAARQGDKPAPDPKAVVAAAHTFTERVLARAS